MDDPVRRETATIIQVMEEEGNAHHTVDQRRLARAVDGCWSTLP